MTTSSNIMKTTGNITPNLRQINDSNLGFRHTFLAESANTSGRSPSSHQSRKCGMNGDQLIAILDEALALSDVSMALFDAIPDAPASSAVKPAVTSSQ
jgi:hypothetical protein